MTTTPLPPVPTADDVRALARSSPWRFRTLHWTHRSELTGDRGREVEAWLQRPGHLTVRVGTEVGVEEGVPYGTSVGLAWPDLQETPDPAASPGLAPEGPDAGDGEGATAAARAACASGASGASGADVETPSPLLRPDGLVAERPEGYHLEHGDPMWQSYLWTAMLDPEELSHDVVLTDVHADDRLGRPTWWATARPLPGYEPRCGCCPLLLGQVSVELEYGPFEDGAGMRGWETRWDDLPTAYLVGLDVQTGIVVDVTPLDGSGGTRLTNDIHAVDSSLAPPPAGGRGSR